MKVGYSHLIEYIPSKPSIDEISEKLFQLGHEHEIDNKIFDLELTPNRGDCLSLKGILRDLAVFFEVNFNDEIYLEEIKPLKIEFDNKAKDACPHISLLKIEIADQILPYKGLLESYFEDLDENKNNFFTDISNYISYETGQPTHCYDAKKIEGSFSLNKINENKEFISLQNKKIDLEGKNLVFLKNNEVINLAGIMGGKESSCSSNTRAVIIECAYFKPEEVIGKAVKYDIKSDAAHKFERGVDPMCQENVLRRFVHLVREHAEIKKIELFQKNYSQFFKKTLSIDVDAINKILGTSLDKNNIEDLLEKLGFNIENDIIKVPSYRSDIESQNDIAEEIARVIGYNNIPTKSINVPKIKSDLSKSIKIENFLKNTLLENGFFEVINYPFNGLQTRDSIKVDNPLDSNRANLRTGLKQSLLENLLYNERRQKDSIKLYEASDVYTIQKGKIKKKRVLGIICSGRVGKNYLDFSKKINAKYLKDIFSNLCIKNLSIDVENISRENIDTKLKSEIIYLEINIDNLDFENELENRLRKIPQHFAKYVPLSEFPSSYRDLSFSVKDSNSNIKLQKFILNFKHELIKESFIFDFFIDKKNDQIKIGFRIIFQSKTQTITENEVNNIMKNIIDFCLSIESVEIPGLINNS